MQTRECEMKRAAAALRWSRLWATPHSLLTSQIEKMNLAKQRLL